MACVVALVDAAYAVNAAGCRCPPLTWLASSRLGVVVACVVVFVPAVDVAIEVACVVALVDAAGSRRGR
jgi:uncharacterized OB-fold protein